MISEVKVGPQTYAVEIRHPEKDGMLSDGNYAYTLDSGNLIVIAAGLSTSKMKQLYIHELLHAIAMVFGSTTKPQKDASYDDWEHHFISIYEAGWLMVMQDNPQLVEWLSN